MNSTPTELRSLLALEEKQLIIAPSTLHYPTPTSSTLHYPTSTPSTLHYPTSTPSTLHYPTPIPSTLHYPTPTPSTLHYHTPTPSTLHYPTPTPSTLHYPTPPCPSLPSRLSKVCDRSKPSYAVTFSGGFQERDTNYEQPTKSKVHVPQVYSRGTHIQCSNLTFMPTTTTTTR